MHGYFNNPTRLVQLVEEATKWPGTPFADFSAVPGKRGGASCGYMTMAVLEACGHIPSSLKLPRIPWRESLSSEISTVEPAFDALVEAGYFASIDDLDDVHPGDVLGGQIQRCVDHIALALPGNQALSIRLRQKAQIAQLYGTTIKRIWRPIDHAN